MKISTRGRYGVKAISVLALHYGRDPVSVRCISKKERIPQDYIEQLFIKLKKCGLIKSVRGMKGGFLLVKPPSKVMIGNVMRCVGEPITQAPYIEGRNHHCVLDKNCIAQMFFKKMSKTLEKVMDSTSLADLCNSKL